MKVRLAAEEYSRHASLCARNPTRSADLLRRRLRVPLASCLGNRARYSIRLRGHAVQPGLAGPGSSGPCNGHPRADTRACDKRRSRGSNRDCRSVGGRDREDELENLPPCDFVAGGCQGRRSEPAAAESSSFPATAEPSAISAAAPQSSAAPCTAPQPSSAPCTTTQSSSSSGLAADACGVGCQGAG
jgi:hypothetical protein